ncbi:mboat-domain-containing protein [Stylonychia lemnae]|uniref:Mboat-domain-containing protein n=1 Tax=Stylonychia lemnae TaxID=5949 RepID=A0A078B0R2_STYLE|nr:mboat-domain-containing protein [Stylonychia lemnae]|eukprot:CDW86947.1 mboat-domain-containing protein [Stylonychia lemnae]
MTQLKATLLQQQQAKKRRQSDDTRDSSNDKRSTSTPTKLKKYIGEAPDEVVTRKKKKTLSLKDVRKSRYAYNDFVPRPSLLDQVYTDSSISQSPFKGMMRLSLIIAFIFVVNSIASLCQPLFDSERFPMNSYFKMNRDYMEAYNLELAVKQTGTKVEFSSKYPKNINIWDFMHFMLHPMVVYETYQSQLIPLAHLLQDGVSSLELFSSFYVPIMMMYFTCFFIVFDFACNFWAEVSGFADRQFYQDFWNSTNFDEYARKWNRLVHEFLYRHFYLEYLMRYKVTVFQANILTFVFSILFHEIFLTVLFHKVSFYLTSLQVIQVSAVSLFQKFKGRLVGNIFFWSSQMFGITSVLFSYTYDYCNFWYNPGGDYY